MCSRCCGNILQWAKGTKRDARVLALHNFPYSLVYRIQGDEIRIVAVAHHSRRPGYWVERR
jgi:hypothetical protein